MRNVIKIIFIGLILGITQTASAAACNDPVYSHDFQFKDLKKIIDSNPSIKSIKDLIPCLPRSYRSNYVLMHSSKSRQESTYQFPRVITYGGTYDPDHGSSLLEMRRVEPTGRFNDYLVITWQGKNFTGLEDDLEVMEFDPATREFKFRSLEFNQDRDARNEPNINRYGTEALPVESITDRYRLSVANPPLCLRCHRTPARPNWTAYPRWPGSYGSNEHNNEESNQFKIFQLTSKPIGRYEHLVDNPGGHRYWIDFKTDSYFPSEAPNHNLNTFLEAFNRKQIARLVTETVDYEKYRYAIYAAVLGCEDIPSFLPESIQKNMSTSYEFYFEDSKRDHQRIARSGNYERELISMASVRYIFENRKINMQDWLMQLDRKKYELAAFGKGIGQSIVDGFLENGEPEFKANYSPVMSKWPSLCASLKPKSLDALK